MPKVKIVIEGPAWTHLVGVFDRASRAVRLYVDGQLVDSQTYGGLELWQAWGPAVMG